MQPTTIRLSDELLDELDAEAREHDFATRTEYLRYLIENRDLVVSRTLQERENRVDVLDDRVDEIEERIEALESTIEGEEEADEPVDELTLGGAEPAADGDEQPELLADIDPESEAPEPLELREPGPDDIAQRVRQLDFFAPTREIRREREEAVVAAWRELVRRGEMSRAEFEADVFPEHTANFSAFSGWYDRLLVPALEGLGDVERVGENEWRHVGE